MPFFKAFIEHKVIEEVIVEAANIDEARNLIDGDSEEVHVLEETMTDIEIRPGSLREVEL